jgi:hypothetical protein
VIGAQRYTVKCVGHSDGGRHVGDMKNLKFWTHSFFSQLQNLSCGFIEVRIFTLDTQDTIFKTSYCMTIDLHSRFHRKVEKKEKVS